MQVSKNYFVPNIFSFIQISREESDEGMYNLIYTMDKNLDSLKMASLPEEYSVIRTFQPQVAVTQNQ